MTDGEEKELHWDTGSRFVSVSLWFPFPHSLPLSGPLLHSDVRFPCICPWGEAHCSSYLCISSKATCKNKDFFIYYVYLANYKVCTLKKVNYCYFVVLCYGKWLHYDKTLFQWIFCKIVELWGISLLLTKFSVHKNLPKRSTIPRPTCTYAGKLASKHKYTAFKTEATWPYQRVSG